MRWKVGDEITGDVARLELPDGAQLQHVVPDGWAAGIIRTVGATVEGMGPQHRGIVGHATYRIRSLPDPDEPQPYGEFCHEHGEEMQDHDHVPAPVDWPARFRKAADVADEHTRPQLAAFLRDVAYLWPYLPAATVEAIGRELGGEGER